MPIAVAIDGAYFLKRFKHSFPDLDASNAAHVAIGVMHLARFHVTVRLQANPVLQAIDGGGYAPVLMEGAGVEETPELYRIFFYDCPPLKKRAQYRVSGRPLNFAKSEVAILRDEIHTELSGIRKVALRLGVLNEGLSGWIPQADAVKRWLADPDKFDPQDEDFIYDIKQKGVDMRLGLDVAAMAFKKQVNQIILVAGDADFVPAVKLARREGVDVVLDPMWGNPAPDLLKHVDGVRNCRIIGLPGSEVAR
jgi:uncharacterized LabA/DUF88 family protein